MLDRIVQPNHRKLFLVSIILSVALAGVAFGVRAHAWLRDADDTPSIDAQACVYEPANNRLVIRGSHFESGATLVLSTPAGPLGFDSLKLADATTLYVEGVNGAALLNGLTITLANPGNPSGTTVVLSTVPTAYQMPTRHADPALIVMPVRESLQQSQLASSEVEQIIAQAVAQAEANGLRAAIAVADAEGRALGVFIMTGAPANTRVGVGRRCTPVNEVRPPVPCGLEGVRVPICTAAISKAVTGSFLSSQGHAFSTRTASFIVQEHFPPGVNFQASGPLFGVQFSQLLCSDVNPKAPLGLSADAGGLPLYKNGIKVGGIGVEGALANESDGIYGADLDPSDLDVTPEELAALAGTRGFEAPAQITGDKIIVNGIRFPYANTGLPPALTVKPFNQLSGALNTCLGLAPVPARGSFPSEFVTATLPGAPTGRINTRPTLFPDGVNSYRSTPDLSRDEVIRILAQAAKQASITRAAIRQPENSPAEVNITVCDAEGNILGIFSTIDAPQFGFDVSAQKARSAAFISNAAAAARLRQAGLGKYVDTAASDGVRLDGALAVSDRAIGFLARPFYPDGIDRMPPGPFSVNSLDFSPFNVGLQLDAVAVNYFENILRFLLNGDMAAIQDALTPPCGNLALAGVANGFQIFPGSVPLYKGSKLVGGIGVSGDGVDQDDIICTMGSTGFEAPLEIRSDRVMVRGTRLPYVKFPRNPNR